MNRHVRLVVTAAALWLVSGCSFLPFYSHVNEPAPAARGDRGIGEDDRVPSGAEVASESVPWDLNVPCRNGLVVSLKTQPPRLDTRATCGHDDPNFVAVAISGGGSRAAVFSAQVLFELQRYGLLEQVDVMSSVSGGSYTAALYALSCDADAPRLCPDTVEGPARMRWREGEVFDLLQRNFIVRWIGNWFWPDNVFRYWLTYYDRTDIMAETLADNLFDRSSFGNEGYRMWDLNPQRPNLVINATDNTFVDSLSNVRRHRNGQFNFTFTKESFDAIQSDVERFPVAYAVVASSAFPGAFQYVTLRDFAKHQERYVHLYDGGTSENLGLRAIDRIYAKLPEQGKRRALVLLIDAYVPSVGKDATTADPRKTVDYFVDTNFLDAYDTLLTNLRRSTIDNTVKLLEPHEADLVWFTFDDLQNSDPDLFRIVSRIPTDLAIGDNDANCLRQAARILVARKLDETLRRRHAALGIPATPRKAAPLTPCNTEIVEPDADGMTR